MRWDWIGAIDMARRFGARIPNCRIDGLAAQCWVDRVEALPMAQQQGRLAAAIAEANRVAGPLEPSHCHVGDEALGPGQHGDLGPGVGASVTI